MIRLGYASTNSALHLTAGKALRGNPNTLRFDTVRERAAINFNALSSIVGWNYANHIEMFRVGTWMITAPNKFDYTSILNANAASAANTKIFVEDAQMRLTIHADSIHLNKQEQFETESVQHLTYLHDVITAVGGSDAVIECHLGAWRRTEDAHVNAVIRNLMQLPEKLRSKLALENDQYWSIAQVIKIARETGTQIAYDLFHHKTWPHRYYWTEQNVVSALHEVRSCANGNAPLLHISSQRAIGSEGSHAALIDYKDYSKMRQLCELAKLSAFDIMVEATSAEAAITDIRINCMNRKPRWARSRNRYLY